MLPEPIVVCTYGWGQVVKLYNDTLDINGSSHALSELVSVQPVYRHIIGISSVQLQLQFRNISICLRGIPLVPEAQILVEYLTRYVSAARNAPVKTSAAYSSARPQGVLETPPPGAFAPAASVTTPYTPGIQSVSTPPLASELPMREGVKFFLPRWLFFRKEQRERRLRRLQMERSLREHGFDVAALARRLQETELPTVYVPLRLLPGECAHYSTDATLCTEPLADAVRYKYQARDHGTLILTNQRMIYLGRKSQLVIGYNRLLHVSNLRNALAFQAEHWTKREIFELPRPLECSMYLDVLLLRFRSQPPTFDIATARTQQIRMRLARAQSLPHASACTKEQGGYWAYADADQEANREGDEVSRPDIVVDH